jgi:REP element-mobilizing transposase RayT
METDKFRNKYRILSARKPNWDYRDQAIYYVTICTQKRVHYFGYVKNGKMILSETGKIASDHWFEISNHFPFIELINFVVMPDHIHGLLEIHDINDNIRDDSAKTVDSSPLVDSSQSVDSSALIETLHATSLQRVGQNSIISIPPDINESMAKISPKRGSLSSVMRSYKSAVSKSTHENGFNFGWQPRYYDHIVRNHDEFLRIYEYISNNPQNWKR